MSRLVVAIVFLQMALPTWADSMAFSRELVTEDIVFGDLTVTKIYDGRDTGSLPIWTVEVTKGDKLVSRIAGAGFENYAISPRGSVFVGISNSGYPDTAYFVIDEAGNLLLFRRHLLEMSQYCEFSMSAIRLWYDNDLPNIEFKDVGSENAEVISGFSVAGCNGERVSVSIR